MNPKKQEEWEKTIRSIIFSNGIKCDSEQFLIEDFLSLLTQAIKDEREKVINELIEKYGDMNLGDRYQLKDFLKHQLEVDNG